MFRKRTKKPNKNLRRKRTDESEKKQDDDENDDDDDDGATGIAIRKTMKKQKILASLPLASGSAVPKEKAKTPSNLEQQSTAELSVLAKKHVRNMEAYIEEKMAASAEQGKKPNKDEDSKQVSNSTTNEIVSEEDLYRQLAREVTANVDDNNNNLSAQDAGQTNNNDGDQGDGGAALLVGTGIAEVILPATAHKPVVATTTSRVYNKNNNLLSSAVPEGERHKHVLSSTTPKPFAKFRSNQNSVANESKRRDETANEETPTTSSTNNTTKTERQGFDAFRGKAPAPDANDGEQDKQKGNRWKTGKDRDDQVYSHFLKNALNGKRR